MMETDSSKFRVDYQVEPDYLECRLEGPAEVDVFVQAMRKVDELRQANAKKRVLVDFSQIGLNHEKVFDIYQTGSELSEFWDKTVRIAFIGRSEQLTSDRFFQMVSRNRGLELRVFDDHSLAIDWLLDRTIPFK